METVPPKKSWLEGLAAILSALGGARTRISHALIEVGLFVGLVFVVIWLSEHSGSVSKTVIGFLEVPGFLVGFGLFIRVLVAIAREIKEDTASKGPGKRGL